MSNPNFTKRFYRQLIIKKASTYNECTIPGEPMIYSVKYRYEGRKITQNESMERDFRKILRCFYPIFAIDAPLVLQVRFYVTPSFASTASAMEVRREKTPAIENFEVCEYLLSFLEMLKKSILQRYGQLVKIDVEKYYSDNPRTVFKMLTWSDYVALSRQDSIHAKRKSQRSVFKIGGIQPKLQRHGKNPPVRTEPASPG